MRTLALLLLLLFAPSAQAGLKFDFSVVSTGDSLNPVRSGTVILEDSSYLVELDEGGVVLSKLVSSDGGESETAINDELRTYYQPDTPYGLRPDSRLFSMPPSDPGLPEVKLLELREEPSGEMVQNHEARTWILRLTYEVKAVIGSETIRGVFDTTAVIWTTEALEGSVVPLDPRRISTGWDSIDQRLEQELAGIKGFPIKRDMTVTRRIVGGSPFTDMITTTFSNFESTEVPPDAFEVPADYVYQEPVIGGFAR